MKTLLAVMLVLTCAFHAEAQRGQKFQDYKYETVSNVSADASGWGTMRIVEAAYRKDVVSLSCQYYDLDAQKATEDRVFVESEGTFVRVKAKSGHRILMECGGQIPLTADLPPVPFFDDGQKHRAEEGEAPLKPSPQNAKCAAGFILVVNSSGPAPIKLNGVYLSCKAN